MMFLETPLKKNSKNTLRLNWNKTSLKFEISDKFNSEALVNTI
jgi:hypothetical protein